MDILLSLILATGLISAQRWQPNIQLRVWGLQEEALAAGNQVDFKPRE